MRFRRTFAVLFVLPLLCRAAPALAKDDLVIGIGEFPSSLHPDIDPLLVKSYVLGFVLHWVSSFNPDRVLQCMMCTELPTIANGGAKLEDQPDGKPGMAVTLHLKPDLKWNDGQPVTARDMAFTWKVGRDPNSGFSNGLPWSRARAVDVVDDHTVVMHLTGPMANYNEWDQVLPEHIEGPIYDRGKGAGDYINGTAYNRAPTTPGLYDGPYQISDYQSGNQIVLTPNPYWAGEKPGFKHIVLRFIGDTAALQANLLSGDIDLTYGLTIDQVLSLRQQYPDRFNYSFTPSLTYNHIDVQKDNPIGADIRVRRALLMSLDRNAINQKLFGGMQPLAATFVSPIDPNFDKSIPVVPFDPAGAKKLLAEAGWTPGPDGICRNASGQKLSLELLASTGYRLVELEQEVMQSMWKNACFEITLRDEPARTLFGQTTKHRSYPGMVMYSWTSPVGEGPRRTLDSASIATAANNWGGANIVAFSDPAMDADIDRAEASLDPVEQKAIWFDMQRIYAEKLPALPLWYSAVALASPKWLKGYGPGGTGQVDTLQAMHWHSE
jgi:peptide/nickel transport system substrate-binding protein